MTIDLTIIILAFNETRHLRRCISSARSIAKRIVVVDSFSTDDTASLAFELGAEVLQNKWVNYATQFNWALDHAAVDTRWVMRLDADEIVTDELGDSLGTTLAALPESVAGVTVNRRIYFLGKWMRHGGIYPAPMLRIWRSGRGRCESRWMDEHVVVQGEVRHVSGDISDINLNNLTWWTTKHNHYASREAVDLAMLREGRAGEDSQTGMSRQARMKRWIKVRIYARLPLGIRAASYFVLRYFLRLGFLDGWRGFAFHVLQGFWYRFLVDAKLFELERILQLQGLSLTDAVKQEYGYEI